MFADVRRKEICKILKEKSAVKVTYLSEKFGVSIETIRKDLLFLEKNNELSRVHGGAVLKPSADRYIDFPSRIEEKNRRKTKFRALRQNLCKTATLSLWTAEARRLNLSKF